MLRAMLLPRPSPPQAGAKGQPLQGHSSQRQLSTKVSGPPLAAASTPGRRAESTASACEIHPLKIQKSLLYALADLQKPITLFQFARWRTSILWVSRWTFGQDKPRT